MTIHNDVVLLTGWFHDQLQIGSSTYFAAGGFDVFWARVRSSDGAILGASRIGGGGDEYCNAIAEDDTMKLYLAGRFPGFAEFSGTTLTSVGDFDGFAVSLAPQN
jgi:hypothetical protein